MGVVGIVGVVVRRYIDFLKILIIPYSTCIISLFCSYMPTSLFIFLMFFHSFTNITLT